MSTTLFRSSYSFQHFGNEVSSYVKARALEELIKNVCASALHKAVKVEDDGITTTASIEVYILTRDELQQLLSNARRGY